MASMSDCHTADDISSQIAWILLLRFRCAYKLFLLRKLRHGSRLLPALIFIQLSLHFSPFYCFIAHPRLFQQGVVKMQFASFKQQAAAQGRGYGHKNIHQAMSRPIFFQILLNTSSGFAFNKNKQISPFVHSSQIPFLSRRMEAVAKIP